MRCLRALGSDDAATFSCMALTAIISPRYLYALTVPNAPAPRTFTSTSSLLSISADALSSSFGSIRPSSSASSLSESGMANPPILGFATKGCASVPHSGASDASAVSGLMSLDSPTSDGE
eukprot:Amastigsp_a680415_64.p3 type:complete len:120 gc:universal Amastigsp_a680415_64:794-1153(+)